MSLGSRIKERREQLHLSRNELSEKIGVTPSAIANYENEISSPKIELMYKLFDALDCDANYLHQDDMKVLAYKNKATPEEFEKLIKRYRDLDTHGKDMVDTVLTKEYARYESEQKSDIILINKEPEDYLMVNAARPRTDLKPEEITDEMLQHDEDIMDDPDF